MTPKRRAFNLSVIFACLCFSKSLLIKTLLVCGVLSADKTLLISMRCFSRMLISNVHKCIIVMNTIDTRFSRNVFEAIQKNCCMRFIES